MWISKKAFDWFGLSQNLIDDLRSELAVANAERLSLRTQLATSQANFDWLRVRVNALEFERAQLIQRAFGVKIPVPEITRQPPNIDNLLNSDLFTDMGDTEAKRNGLPTYDFQPAITS